ncbi:MAG TPA: ComEA family DNA-binding protein [Galbitalea sp.]|nr:ComEA family DNA-binding protein [Galbitalea sp.]
METEETNARSLRLRLGLGAGVVLVLVAAGVAVLVSALSPHGVTATASVPRVVHTTLPTANDAPTAFVHVVGQVKNPGLYELPAGDRILDAVAAAGGFVPGADQADLNLAQVIEDGQQIVVAQLGVSGVAVPMATPGGKVDLNTADATALETLDGIGPALAQRILAYRAAHGGFRTVNDLQNVTGIGPKKFAAIKANVST